MKNRLETYQKEESYQTALTVQRANSEKRAKQISKGEKL